MRDEIDKIIPWINYLMELNPLSLIPNASFGITDKGY